MTLKLKEMCRRTRLADGVVTFHHVNAESGKLMQISETTYRDFEARAVRTDTLYSRNDTLFQRDYMTVRYN